MTLLTSLHPDLKTSNPLVKFPLSQHYIFTPALIQDNEIFLHVGPFLSFALVVFAYHDFQQSVESKDYNKPS